MSVHEYVSVIIDGNIMWFGHCKTNSEDELISSYNCGVSFEDIRNLGKIRKVLVTMFTHLSSDFLGADQVFAGPMSPKIRIILEEFCQSYGIFFKTTTTLGLPKIYEGLTIEKFTQSFGQDMNELSQPEKDVMAILYKELFSERDDKVRVWG